MTYRIFRVKFLRIYQIFKKLYTSTHIKPKNIDNFKYITQKMSQYF